MATVLFFNGIKIKIYARDHNPPHCHIEGKGGKARFNLSTWELMESEGFTRRDIMSIKELLELHAEELLAYWGDLHE